MKMKRFFLVLVVIGLLGAGCQTRPYENSGGTTEEVVRTPDGGFWRTTSYRNKGTGPRYYYPVWVNYEYRYSSGGYGGYRRSPVIVPAAPDVRGLLPPTE